MALLMAMVALAAGATMLLFNALDPVAHKQKQSRETAEALAEAKAALLGWAVSHPDVPGMMPFPDRNNDGNYDGHSDCPGPGTPSGSHLLLGRLPWKEQDVWIDTNGNLRSGFCLGGTSVAGLSINVFDGAGERLWFAVSRNLVTDRVDGDQEMPVVDWTSPEDSRWPWLTVRDERGAVISNRVAAVIIAPGRTLPGQVRVGDTAAVGNYLDSVTVSGDTYSNADDVVEDFIIYPDTQADPNSRENFNDRVVYISVDELMRLLEQRALKEVEDSLTAYRDAEWNSDQIYPWLSPFTDPRDSDYKYDSELDAFQMPFPIEGHLPIHLPNEVFETSFAVQWNSFDAEVSKAKYVTRNDDGDVVGDIAPYDGIGDSLFMPDTRAVVGSCVWGRVDTIDCEGSFTQPVQPGSLKEEWAGITEPIIRTYTFYPRFLGTSYELTAPRRAGIGNAPASAVRTRAISIVRSELPARTGNDEALPSVLKISIRDQLPPKLVELEDLEGDTVERSLTVNEDTIESVVVSGVKYDLDSNTELPHWIWAYKWHQLIYVAYAWGCPPANEGDPCPPEQRSLTVKTARSAQQYDEAKIITSEAVIIAAGRALSGQSRTTAGVGADDYFEGERFENDDRSSPGYNTFLSLKAHNASYNDVVRVLNPSP